MECGRFGQIVKQITLAGRHRPACCVLRNRLDDELVLCVRGTDEVADILTAAEVQPTPLLDGTHPTNAQLCFASYGYASDDKKSVHAKRFLKSWYFRGYGPGYGMLFRLFSAIRRYSPLFSDQNVSSVSYSRYFL